MFETYGVIDQMKYDQLKQWENQEVVYYAIDLLSKFCCLKLKGPEMDGYPSGNVCVV